MYRLYRCCVNARVRILTTAWILAVITVPNLMADGSLQGLIAATGRTGGAAEPPPPAKNNSLNQQHIHHDHYYDSDDSTMDAELFIL